METLVMKIRAIRTAGEFPPPRSNVRVADCSDRIRKRDAMRRDLFGWTIFDNALPDRLISATLENRQ
jgi:hypothetical protein